jgi:hypothetical protein
MNATFPEAAAFLGIGRSKMFAFMADGTVPTVRVFDGGQASLSVTRSRAGE